MAKGKKQVKEVNPSVHDDARGGGVPRFERGDALCLALSGQGSELLQGRKRGSLQD